MVPNKLLNWKEYPELHFSIATPADWLPGDDVIVPPAGSCGQAHDRMDSKDPDMKCYDWFFCTKKLDKEKVLKAVLKK